MFFLNLISKQVLGCDVFERPEEEREHVSRNITLKQLEKALVMAYHMGQRSTKTDEEEF